MNIVSSFAFTKTEYATQGEELASRTFSDIQVSAIRNTMLQVIEEKLNMPSSEPDFFMRQEFLRGQISILQYITEVSTSASSAFQAST